jgi:hypothetical protein
VQISDTHLDGVAAHDHHAVGGELGKACHDGSPHVGLVFCRESILGDARN